MRSSLNRTDIGSFLSVYVSIDVLFVRYKRKGPQIHFWIRGPWAYLFAYRIELQGASAQKCAYARLVADQFVVGE